MARNHREDERPLPLFILLGSALVFFACALIFISFCSPNWLEKDKRTPNQFIKIGLWEVCFDGYRHPKYQYDRIFTGCRWIFHRDMRIIREYLEPGWFVFVQVFMTFGFITIIASTAMSVAILLQCFRDRHILFFKGQAICLWTSFGFTAIAVVTFGVRGDNRDWMPSPHFNHFSWSFALAVIACLAELTAGGLYWLQAQRMERRKRMMSQPIQYPPNGTPHQPPYYIEKQPAHPTYQPQQPPIATITQVNSSSKEDTV